MFNIELTEQELNIIGQALGEMPYRLAEPVLRKLQEQVNQQQQQPQFEEMPEGAQVQ